MNKLFKKISMAFVGMAMAVGVGVAIGTSRSAIGVRATDEPYATCDFTAKKNFNNNYTDAWTYDGYPVSGGNNNGTEKSHDSAWAYVKFGRKKSKGSDPAKVDDGYVRSPQLNQPITKVGIQIAASTVNNSAVTWGLDVYSDSGYSTAIGSVSLTSLSYQTAGTYYLEPTNGTPWATGSYYQVNIHCENDTTTNGLVWVEKVIFYYDAPTPVSSISLGGTGVSENALSIGSSDEDAHSVTASINNSATDKQINIAHKAGTNGLFILGGLTDGHITCNASGVGTFTVTGTNATSGSETFSVTSNSTPAQTLDFTVTALNDSLAYCDIETISNYSLSGVTHIVSGEDASLTLVPDSKYKLPSEVTVINTDTEEEIDDSLYAYDDSDGTLLISEVGADLTVTFAANPASIVSLALSGQKTSFKQGQSLDLSTLVVTGTYDDDVEPHTVQTLLSSEYTVATEYDKDVPGTYPVRVSLKSNEAVYAEFNVTVVGIVSFTYSGVDTLTRGLIGVTGTSYTDWSGKAVSDGSSAVYAGCSAGQATVDKVTVESIQLRSSGSTSGIVTTTSGGLATKVAVSWKSETMAGRTLNIYGKNTAYSVPTDLYSADAATQGTLIGTIVKGTSTELNITSDYAYIGIRSNDGALYLDQVNISWTQTKAVDADVSVVNAFINSYMQPEIAHNADPSEPVNNNGDCASEGWYSDAKAAFNALKTRQRAIILTSSSLAQIGGSNSFTYNQIKDRLLAWAAANGDALNGSNVLAANYGTVPSFGGISIENGNLPLIITFVAIGTVAAAGVFLFSRRRRDEK